MEDNQSVGQLANCGLPVRMYMCMYVCVCRSLSAEWSVHGLRFNCIAPGPIYTKVPEFSR